MLEVRHDEPDYAFLKDNQTKTSNRYGTPIETIHDNIALAKQALNINGQESVSENPNRYKQHGFFFNSDNCIACHACETACSEKNDNPSHIAFRSVGYVEGGTYPAYQRINISLACNHCDDPVCLKGCPTRAYTKFAEYGAVLQDPDICFGCGYCTWVCPYNAPQLDPVEGQVSKCNMCIDRLEVGLKPACVSACLGNALDFGVIENIPEGRYQAKTSIPGFPSPEITQPNIRFQQTRGLEKDITRTDDMPIKYHQDPQSEEYLSALDEKHGKQKRWSLKKLLSSHENAHIAFTLAAQAVIGSFIIAAFMPNMHFGLVIAQILLISFGLFKLNMHLGKPHRFYRGFNNLRHSPVSREIAGISMFYTGLLFYAVCMIEQLPLQFLLPILQAFAILSGLLGCYYMIKLYRIKARPYWNHWQTNASFIASMLSLGSILVLWSVFPTLSFNLLTGLTGLIMTGLLLESLGLIAHRRYLKQHSGESAAAHYLQTTEYAYSYYFRNGLLAINLLLCIGLILSPSIPLLAVLSIFTLTSAILSRALFFVLVIPTTMPGAFFWKNAGFVDHARETGLADMEPLGVVYEKHHPFLIGEIFKTLRQTSIKEMWQHSKRILHGG